MIEVLLGLLGDGERLTMECGQVVLYKFGVPTVIGLEAVKTILGERERQLGRWSEVVTYFQNED